MLAPPEALCVPHCNLPVPKVTTVLTLMVIMSLGLGLGLLCFFLNVFFHLYVFLKTISLALPVLKLYMESYGSFLSVIFCSLCVFIIHSFVLLIILHYMKCYCSVVMDIWGCFGSLALVNNADMNILICVLLHLSVVYL